MVIIWNLHDCLPSSAIFPYTIRRELKCLFPKMHKGKKGEQGRKERGLWGMAGYMSLEAGKGRVGPHILRNPSSLIFPGWTDIYKDFPWIFAAVPGIPDSNRTQSCSHWHLCWKRQPLPDGTKSQPDPKAQGWPAPDLPSHSLISKWCNPHFTHLHFWTPPILL